MSVVADLEAWTKWLIAKFHHNDLPPPPVVGQGPITVSPLNAAAPAVHVDPAATAAIVDAIQNGRLPAPVSTPTPAPQIPPKENNMTSTDPRTTADIVAECGKLAQSIHDLQAKQAAGDGSVGPQLTKDSQQLDHDERELAKRHAAGDTAAVFKNPFAR